MIALATIPEISITFADQSPNSTLTPVVSSIEIPVFVAITRLVVPPSPSDGPSRRTLVQRGLRLGSYRLNCAESVLAQHRNMSSATSVDNSNNNAMRRAFNWAKTSPLASENNSLRAVGLARAHSHRGHSRARSLNSLADLNETLKLNVVPAANNTAHSIRHESRTQSIDLSVLCTSPTAFNTSHHFASAL